MTNDFLSIAKKALLKGNRLESLHILTGNVRDSGIIHQLQELEIRQNSLLKKINAGTIDFKDIQQEENRISSSILSIINNLQRKTKNEAKLFPTKAKGFDVKWLVIAVLILGMLGLGYYAMTKKQRKQIPVDRCAKIVCQNEGKCNDGICKCPSGYEGRFCQIKKAAIATADPCKNINCQNGGKCIDGTCQCPPGYEGKLCEIKKVEDFKMYIEDVFTITGRGTVVTGKIASGEVKKGDRLKIVINGKEVNTICLGIEILRKQIAAARKGDSVGLLLRGVDKGSLEKGMVIRK